MAHRRQATVGGYLVMDRRWPDISFPPWVASDGGLLVAYYRRPKGIRAQVGPPVDMNPYAANQRRQQLGQTCLPVGQKTSFNGDVCMYSSSIFDNS